MTQTSLTILNTYVLKGSAEEFTRAIAALVARVKAEGHPGVQSYRFFVTEQGIARGVIDYSEPAAWIGHHDIAMEWPEMKALHTVAKLSEVTFLGPLTDEIRNWLAGSGLTAQVESGYTLAAGFRRA